MAGTIIITGAAGFIGSHLAAAFIERGHRIVGIDNFDPFYDRRDKERNVAELEGDRFELIEADICDREAMRQAFETRQPVGVAHIAALAGVRPSIEAPQRYARANVDGLVSILDAARSVECRRILFASSSSVYGNNRKVPFAETDDVSQPISPYAATKRAGELICHAYSHLFGQAIAALRFFTVYGPRQRPDLAISKFMRLVAQGEPIPMFGDGSTSRDYTYIDDIVAGILAAWERTGEADGGFFRIYNLGGSQPVTLKEMIDAIGRVSGRTPAIRQLPMQPGDVDRTFADLSRSTAELGYEPRTPFDEGLAHQWRWLVERGEVDAVN
jgi:UDP-glucuronate 4-epimerase